MDSNRLAGAAFIVIGAAIGGNTVLYIKTALKTNEVAPYSILAPAAGLIGTLCLIGIGIGIVSGKFNTINENSTSIQHIIPWIIITIVGFGFGLATSIY